MNLSWTSVSVALIEPEVVNSTPHSWRRKLHGKKREPPSKLCRIRTVIHFQRKINWASTATVWLKYPEVINNLSNTEYQNSYIHCLTSQNWNEVKIRLCPKRKHSSLVSVQIWMSAILWSLMIVVVFIQYVSVDKGLYVLPIVHCFSNVLRTHTKKKNHWM